MKDIPEELAIVERPEHVMLGTLQASSPTALVLGATDMAKALADVIDRQGLYSKIQGRNFVRVEGWVTLATMMGTMPRERSVVRLEDGGYEATVDLVRISDGVVLTSASAECGSDESTWASRPRYARRSMAITRATSKACRIAFSWVMSLAGYECTPAEEMDGVNLEPRQERDVTPQPRKLSPKPAPASDSAEPAWFDEKIKGGKHAGKTWREMSQGSLGGERMMYVDWMATKAQKLEPETIKRARYVLSLYTVREVGPIPEDPSPF